MIKIISHRGAVNGPSVFENRICQIDYCLSLGFGVEIDCWKLEGEDCFRLGHGKPILSESVPLWFLENENLWIHCKNQNAYDFLSQVSGVNCFQHTDEDWVKTSKGFAWIHSRIQPSPYMMPNDDNRVYTYFVDKECGSNWDKKIIDVNEYFICTDYPLSYRK